MTDEKKYCKHCGEIIHKDAIVCPKCGLQVEELKNNTPDNIIINNSSSASASASANIVEKISKKMPWYLRWFWIIVLGFVTGGGYLIVGIILREIWKSKNSN